MSHKWQGPRLCFTLKTCCNSPHLRSKSVCYDFPNKPGIVVSKRQKMAIITAIMVINGNSKMALNSRSICDQLYHHQTAFSNPFLEFSTNLRSAEGSLMPCRGDNRSGRLDQRCYRLPETVFVFGG